MLADWLFSAYVVLLTTLLMVSLLPDIQSIMADLQPGFQQLFPTIVKGFSPGL